ncbi:toll/interleukin-1 receptor domain-containing protein [Hymenobacter sp. CRA2]|uniref:toll/interleukin-1 receptor domain-containing protein n=1 Tax=Hymenobacter sp. CRA2 TaxID=1955620 RepID=UPI00098F6B6E|nr:toll/interleukin-1 receptor domain-containing protein [Hymenobacter sp. CRA2]OON67771.1 hypothetical protein B0919_16380 [Hymenobacter sp. CRA2]
MSTRTDAFVSYSHADQRWLARVKVHLKPLVRGSGIVVWEDTHLRGGQRWREEIDKALSKAKVAILLVSPDFLASDFIHNNELPPLLEAAQREGVTILSVIVSTCFFRRSVLSEFQAINTPDTALDTLSDGEVNRVLVRLADRVDELFAAAPAAVALAPAHKSPPAPAAVAEAAAPRRQPKPALAAPLALLVKNDGSWETVEVLSSRVDGGTEVHLTLQPTQPAQRAFLASLHQRINLASVVFNEQLYPCRLRNLSAQTQGAEAETWQLVAEVRERPEGMDYIFNGQTPEKRAQFQADLLLLNQRPPTDASLPYMLQQRVADDYLPPLVGLYHYLGQDKAAFKQVAPLIAAWYLHMGNIVHHIYRLHIKTDGNSIEVDFEGQRQAQYHGKPAVISVKGACALPKDVPAEALDVRLRA